MKKILYITTSFPSITLTFIYREIKELERAGYRVSTVSMNKPVKDSLSEEVLPYFHSTFYLSSVALLRKFMLASKLATTKPNEIINFLKAMMEEREVKNAKDYIRIFHHFLQSICLYSKYKEEDFDHIHAHFLTGPTSIAFFLSHLLKIPFSFTMHASLIFVDPLMLKTKLRCCKKAVTVSNYNKLYLIQKYGKEFDKKVKIIHCGIDLADFTPSEKVKDCPPMILSVGQLTERKGFNILIDACHILKEKGLDFFCLIVGDGGQKAILSEKIQKLDLNNGTVQLLGRQPQEVVRELLEKASIFCLPSIITSLGMREGIPVAVMEAMAMKLPVITTETVGIPELVENGREGILVRQKDKEKLAEAISFLLHHPETRKKMGESGRNKISEYFNIEATPALFKEIFH